MSGWSQRDGTFVKDWVEELGAVRLEAPSALDGLLEALRGELDATAGLALRLRPDASSWSVDLFHSSGLARTTEFQDCATRFFSTAPPRFAWYNAVSPEPRQRNRVIEAISQIPAGQYEASRIYSEVMVPMALERHKQLRVLVCDGPALLAWFGVFQLQAVETRSIRMLRELVPALRRRLLFDRRLKETERKASAFEIAIEEIAAPVYLLDRSGGVREANAAGRALLACNASTVRAALRETVARPRTNEHIELTPLHERSGRSGWFAVLRGVNEREGPLLQSKIERAAARWALTTRQRQVLRLLAEAAANARVAAELGISERTVEDHVAAILLKAQVATRAELIAALHA